MATVRMVSTLTGSIGPSVTWYSEWGMAGAGSSATTTELNAQSTIQVAGTTSGMWAYVSANGLSGTLTVRLRKNTANGNQVLTFAGGVTGAAEDVSNTDSVAAGDVINYSLATGAGGTTATPRMIATTWAPSANTSTVLVSAQSGAGRTFSADSTSNFTHPTGGLSAGLTEANTQVKFRVAGTIAYLTARVTGNTRITTTTVNQRINGANGNGVLSVGTLATGLFQDTSNTDAVAVNDLVCTVIVTGIGGGNFIVSLEGFTFTTTSSKGYFIAGGLQNNLAGATDYVPAGGQNLGAGLTEAWVAHKQAVAATLSNFAVFVSANAATSTSTARPRINSANGNQVVSISAAATGYFEDTSNTDTVATGDTLDTRLVNGGGGTIGYRTQQMVALYRVSYTLALATGVFTLTGNAANLKVSRTLAIGTGAFTLTGNAVNLKVGRTLALGTGVVALTGQVANLKVGRTLTIGVGSFVLVGSVANLKVGRVLPIATGTFILTGNAANLKVGRTLAIGVGSFVMSGQAANLRLGNTLAISSGTFSLTGNALGLRAAITVLLSRGSFVFTGVDVGLRYVAVAVAGGKYRPEHDSALADLGAAVGFAAEHTSALRDLADAGI